ncbi:tyrosine-type recombinase/integrase [Dactylosporangium sp. CA-152071]|uniref:tyrosine-type recombinase/integrase n=1 Tax=Dactylosporangium sp. CA-152071 TaxID=3239933 RepID=UPI003D8C4B46
MTVVVGEVLPAAAPRALTAAAAGAVDDAGDVGEVEQLLREWLLGYGSTNTRDAYGRDVRRWLAYCAASGIDPLTEASRTHTHGWLRVLEADRDKPATRARRLAAVSSWYAWMIAEERTHRANPAAIDTKRKPKAPTRSSTAGLTREQAMALLAAADADTGPQALRAAAIVAVLLLTGIRVSELVGADVEDLGYDRGHRVLGITAKGEQTHTVVLPPPAVQRVDAYHADREDLAGDRLPVRAGQAGARARRPLVVTGSGGRMDRGAVWRLLRRLARAAGIKTKMSPHVLRHAYATLSRDAGARLEDIQDGLGHADPRTTRRYDRAGLRLDRSPGYTLASYLG